MQDLLPGRTPWETEQYGADHGMTAKAAAGYADLSAYLTAHGLEDHRVLGLSQPPGPAPYLVPVSGSSDEDARAKVGAWAALRGVTAGWDETTGTYRAVKMLGAVPYIVFMRPAGRRADMERIARQRPAIADAAAQVLAASRTAGAA